MFSILSVLHHGPTSSVPGYHIKTVSPFGGGHSEVFTHVPAEQGAAPATAAGVSDSMLLVSLIDFLCRPRPISRQRGELGR
jgi:hypothetical protein